MKVLLACGHGLNLTYFSISHASNARVTSLGVGRDTKGALALTLVESLEKDKKGREMLIHYACTNMYKSCLM